MGVVLAVMAGGGTGCAGDAVVTTAPGAPPPGDDRQVAAAIAATTALWRDADPAKHPKGSCSGCHGADWFDLARIGSTDADLVRRAQLDGATPAQAQQLVTAVRAYRARYAMPAENPRTFRPFQPGGAPLPGATGRERDVAFGEQLVRLLPTMAGAPIRDAATARRAMREIADLVRGTDDAGANGARLHLRTLPTGVVYPLWSADVAHGAGTTNDWIGDLARDPAPRHAAEWRALVDAYVAAPGNETFWAMYAGVDRLLRPIDSANTMAPFFDAKFRSALIGQHLLRMSQLGRLDEFARPGVAFAYLDAPALRAISGLGRRSELAPHLWAFADVARLTFANRTAPVAGSEALRFAFRASGSPDFVVTSVDPSRSWLAEESEIRLAWFWLGWTFDPTLRRTGETNSIRNGEYLLQSLGGAGMSLHRLFADMARNVAVATLPAGSFDAWNGVQRAMPAIAFEHHVWYFGHWRLPAQRDHPASPATESRQRELVARLAANYMRTMALLVLDAAASGTPPPTQERVAAGIGHMREFLESESPATLADDMALLRRVATLYGDPLP
jgi:hypothetical protein